MRPGPRTARRTHRPAGLPVALPAVLLAVATAAACSSSNSSATPATKADAHVANVTIASDRCVTDQESYAAGGVTFNVANKSATGVSEIEILDGERILAEKENVPPGFSGTFSVNLQPRTYTLYCPGATTERVPLKITGTATAAPVTDIHQLLVQGSQDYGDYVDRQVQLLVDGTKALDGAVRSGNVSDAQAAYAKARPYYERVEPVAESFAGLDPAIDNRADDVPVTRLTGFHRIEYGLYTKKSTAGLATYSSGLVRNVEKLQKLSGDLSYQPSELANGAVGLLDEVSKSKITGEEERYSHIDLLDFQANVEGSEQAFANLQPALEKIDPTLSATISSAFTANLDLLDTYRTSDNRSGFTLYQRLTATDKKKLSASVQVIAEPLSRVASKVVDA